ncbi:hypothetical protein HND97_06390 [Vibrio cholerae]|nr:hypothetical protein HND97_06390 [Vibrio cholerae]
MQSVELQPEFYAILDPAPKLINAQLHSIQRELLLSFGVSALVTVLMLLLLLYRHVINPILHLDKQHEEVENNQRKNIENSILTMKLGGFPRVLRHVQRISFNLSTHESTCGKRSPHQAG